MKSQLWFAAIHAAFLVQCSAAHLRSQQDPSSLLHQNNNDRSLFSLSDLSSDVQNYWNSVFHTTTTTTGGDSSSGNDQQDDGYTYLLVKVLSDRARSIVYGLLGGEVTKDFVEDGFLAVKIANEYLDAAVQQFDADPDIEGYEDDGLFEEQGTIDEYVSMDEHHGRKLDETVPYGITLTEGDQVQAGENPPTVCIIDTGVARLHPDLNTNLLNGINRVSNVDSTSLQWYNDTRGHGTHVSTGTLFSTCFY